MQNNFTARCCSIALYVLHNKPAPCRPSVASGAASTEAPVSKQGHYRHNATITVLWTMPGEKIKHKITIFAIVLAGYVSVSIEECLFAAISCVQTSCEGPEGVYDSEVRKVKLFHTH